MRKFSSEQYIKERKKRRLIGGIGTFIAIFNMLDAGLPFPIPLTGHIAIYVSLFILFPSLYVLINSLLPPTIRTVEEVAKTTNGYITSAILINFLDVSDRISERLVCDLFMKGYLDIKNRVTDDTPISRWLCIFAGVSREQTDTTPHQVRDQNMSLTEYTSENPEMSVDDINDALLGGSLNLGQSGQPT